MDLEVIARFFDRVAFTTFGFLVGMFFVLITNYMARQ